MFARVHQELVERGSFTATMQNTGRPRTARTLIFEESLLHAMVGKPETSVRTLAAATETSPSTVHHVLQGEALQSFHLQIVQLLKPEDHLDVRVCPVVSPPPPPAHCAIGLHFFSSVSLEMKQSFHVKGYSKIATSTCEP